MTRGWRLARTAIALWAVVVVLFAISLAGPPIFNGLTILNILAIAAAATASAKALRCIDVERETQKRRNHS